MYKLMQFVSVSSLISFPAYTYFNIDAVESGEGWREGKVYTKNSICRLNTITHSRRERVKKIGDFEWDESIYED